MAMRICGGWLSMGVLGMSFASAPANAQRSVQALRHKHHTTWGASDGMMAAGTGLMQRSGDGYLWIQNRDGLLRFDGVRFRVIDSLDSPALRTTSSGAFVPLFVDRDNAMWSTRPDGALLRYADGRFTTVLGPDPSRVGILRGVQDRTGRMWFITARGLFILKDRQLVRSGITPAALDTVASTVIADTGTGVWVGGYKSVWHLSRGRLDKFDVPDPEVFRHTRPLCQLRDGTLYIGAYDLFTLKDGVWTRVRYEGQTISWIHGSESREHDALIAARGLGLLRFRDGRPERLSPREGLTSAVVKATLPDQEGSIWITTEGGLDRLRTAPFTTFTRRDGAPFDAPLGVESDPTGGVWIDTWDGGSLIHARGGAMDERDATDVRWNTPVPTTVVENYGVLGSSRGGGIWAVGHRGTERVLRRMSPTGTPSFMPLRLPRGSNILAEDRGGTVWISLTPAGFVRMRDGRVDSVPLPLSGQSRYVQWVAVDSLDHTWVAINEMKVLYEFVDGRIVATIDSTTGLPHPVERIRAAGGDTLWMVLAGGSLARMIGHRLRELQIPSARELLRQNSVAIVPRRHDFWLASPVGIGRVKMTELNAYADGRAPPPLPRYYDREDGLPVPIISGNATRHGAALTREGDVVFSTPAGIAIFDDDLDVRNPIAPHALVEDVTVSGRPLPYDSLLVVPPAPDRVEIRYTATSLRIPARVRIEYRLDGVDDAWVPGNALRTATYSQLRPGRYRFRVRAWNEDGVPSMQEASLSVRVLPRWFESTGFVTIALLTLVAGGPLLAISRTRARATAREHRLRERFDATLAERGRLSRELHDTLLQGFTGITLKLQAVRATMLTSPNEAAATLTRVLDESDLALIDARQMIWDMRLTELEDRDLCDAIEESGRRMVGDAPIDFRVNLTGDGRRLSPGVESVLYRICREAVANALKHARASAIVVEVTYESATVRLRVRDNGVGVAVGAVDDASSRGHFGISGMLERAARAGGSLTITAVASGGTEITVSLPTVPESA
ncbi:MAG: hypothetical protein H7099_11260 [Gemmatimonadaceae bacterium]|nr:hypothetical protein [Gemmatimonadaceae bacterium]